MIYSLCPFIFQFEEDMHNFLQYGLIYGYFEMLAGAPGSQESGSQTASTQSGSYESDSSTGSDESTYSTGKHKIVSRALYLYREAYMYQVPHGR